MTFKEAFKVIIMEEGGYVNDPLDRGGKTKYGISQRAYPNLQIANLTLKDAKAIYIKDYWLKSKCDQLPADLKLIHFDTAVNMGVITANKLLQRSIGGITVDGIIGPQTLSRTLNVTPHEYLLERANEYIRIIVRRPLNLRFAIGWFKRLNRLNKRYKETYKNKSL